MLLNKIKDKINQIAPLKAQGRTDSQMIRWLWIVNGSVLTLALLILIIGLLTLIGGNPLADGSQVILRPEDTAGSDQVADGSNKLESPLVAMVRKYSTRYNPPKPKPKPKPKLAPKPKPKPKVAPKPKVVPKPAPKPKQVVKPPTFTVEATLMIGDVEGLAWIKPPKAKQPNLYAVGEKIDQYEIIKIEHGIVELMREKTNFTIKVPEKKKEATPSTIKAKAVTPKANTTRKNRKRPTRKARGK